MFFSLHNVATGILPVATQQQVSRQPAYDLYGRPANSRSHLIITKDKKTINK